MPISNKSSQKRMTETSIRISSAEAYGRQQGLTTQRKPVIVNNQQVSSVVERNASRTGC